MGSKTLNTVKIIGIDSNIFSYQFHQEPTFGPLVKRVFDDLSSYKLKAVTSIITLTEVLSVEAQPTKIKQLEHLLLRATNVAILEVDLDIAREAAKIRREYGFRTPDAIQLATAIQAKAKVFITNDKRLKNFKKIKVILVTELWSLG